MNVQRGSWRAANISLSGPSMQKKPAAPQAQLQTLAQWIRTPNVP